ncbi:S8 family peptidase [Alteromonas sp. ASW11-130]|uniref:S8 family peptidase n=1 Tax=Alteromonas sp. ASW11-130 TaxID=3015775 RepID=UPI002241B1FC|nr:S8 family peptidase [Alteromonas sp. ASW11-130]MCW8091824.1 S8 family serine peptidase [Alteromonas sp. ASW11-130]
MKKIKKLALITLITASFTHSISYADEDSSPQYKMFLNDQTEYLSISFKIDEKLENFELNKGKFKKLDGMLDKDTFSLNSLPFLKKVKRIHGDKTYKEYRKKYKEFKARGKKLPKLENWYSVPLSADMSHDEILMIYNALVAVPIISHIELETPVISTEYVQCPYTCDDVGPPGGGGSTTPTPNLQSHQGYLTSSPYGIDADYAWTKPGGNGAGVKIIDMENGYNSNHEDLPSPFIRVNDNDNDDHGTAVMSVLGARNNGIGVKGIAYGSQLGFYGWGSSTSGSIRAAADNLSAGDVMVLEGQINRNINSGDRCDTTNHDECVPMEWNQANFDAIRYAYLKGVVVVEAAGNGNEDLDSSIYNNRFDLNTRDSGAFLVAATVSSSTITRSGFSNHGTRIDFNAWGDDVAAAGLYGTDLFNEGIDRRYGAGFGGTSSASPIVAGAVASLQGFSKQSKGATLDVETIRTILSSTGVQEPSGVQVGVRPDLRDAIDELDYGTLATPSLSAFWDACYGSNQMSWNAIPGATSYKIYLNGAYWTSQTSTFKSVNVSSTKSATVQACNSSGCSASSNSVTLRYASACY